MKVEVLNINGSAAGRSVDLPEDIFGLEPNDHAIYLAVKAYNAHQRQGTHKAKEKGEITGSTRKLKKQKGTGTARAGSIKSGVFRGGGRMFGPRPRTYTVSLNKKVKRLARASALSYKATSGNLKVVQDFTFDSPKTKEMINVINSLELDGKKAVFVTGDYDKNLLLSTRNIPRTNLINAKDLNTYDIMNANTLVISESAIEKIKETFNNK
jgi:large subunit ribosomal protein L4